MNIPQTRYARSQDGAYIAYQVFGDGDVDLLWISPWFSHLELLWEHPPVARFHREMASFARVIMIDQRGVGLSDRSRGFPDLETRVDDLRAVLDAAGSERTVLWGAGPDGGSLCAMFAAMYPERVPVLAFWNAWAKTMRAADYPHGSSPEFEAAFDAFVADGWGLEERTAELMLTAGASSVAADPAAVRWAARTCRAMGSPGDVLAFDALYREIDFRAVCPAIHVPTVAIFTDEGPEGTGDYEDLVTRIPGAKAVIVPPGDFAPWPMNIESAVGALRDFVRTTHDEEADLDRVLATVLFTDIVGSTATAAAMGDAKWRDVVEEHDRLAKGLIARYRGTYQRSTGDGLLATFDGPARGVRCAQALVAAMKPLGIAVRAGVHTGEITLGGADLAGLGVHVAARVADLAGTSEVWASSTVKDLTAGSGLTFEDRGECQLKGVPDSWRLYRVVTAAP